jgi:hypothetical protein
MTRSVDVDFKSHKPFEPPATTLKGLEKMNAHELRTPPEKAETRPELVVRKVEKNLRQTENSKFELRLFRVYQPLTSIFQQKLKFLKQPPHTTIVDCTSAGIAQSRRDAAGSTPVRLEPSSLEMQTVSRLFSASSLAGLARTRFTTFQITQCNVQAFGSAAFSRYLQITEISVSAALLRHAFPQALSIEAVHPRNRIREGGL